jgi:hypothetical protein
VAAIRDKAKKFHKFVKGLQSKHPQALPDGEAPLLDRFIFYLFLYSNPVTYARRAYKAFKDVLAPRLKQFLQKVFEEIDDTRFEAVLTEIEAAEDAKQRKQLTDAAKKAIAELPGIPPWGATYLLTGLGFDSNIPWDPHTEAVLEAQKAFPPKSTLAQKKRIAKALLDGLELDTLSVHHLLVEHAKKDLKR